jgi:PAS domain-containing protein
MEGPEMTALAFDFIVSMLALSVMLALVMVTSSAPRVLRVGIAAATSVVIASASLSMLSLAGEPIGDNTLSDWLASLKVLALSWAALDVARIAMRIGTLDPVTAANTARGFLISTPALRSVWSAWASSVPVPCWVKSQGGEMLAMNASYEARYGKSEHAYLGQGDAAVWDAAVAEDFHKHDALVLQTRRAHVFEEPAPLWKAPHRSSLFLKFPVVDGHGRFVAVGGMEIADADGVDVVRRWSDQFHPHRRASDRGDAS